MEKIILLLFPFFFLTTSQEFFTTNKFYLLSFGALLLMIISALRLFFTKKIIWKSSPLDAPIITFVTTVALSIAVSSTNKIQAIFNPNFGLLMIASLAILYFYLSRSKYPSSRAYNLGSIILSLITIVFFFQPFRNITLPASFQFLKNSLFTPVGNQLDLSVFLGFFLIYGLIKIITDRKQIHDGEKINKYLILNTLYLILHLLALSLTLYSIFKNNSFILPPFSISWYAGLEVLKNLRTAFFGVGVEGFSSVFTLVKDFAYNQSPLWQVSSFNVAANTPLHILTETGILGLVAFGFLAITIIKTIMRQSNNRAMLFVICYLLFVIFFLPPSLPIFFLFFIILADITRNISQSVPEKKVNLKVDLNELPILYVGMTIFILTIVGVSGYFLGRSYIAEVHFKKSLDEIYKKNVNDKVMYDNMRSARLLSPYDERYIFNFSQVNFLIANNMAQSQKDNNKEITDEDKQIMSQAIQTAISEGKELIRLSPRKAQYYENLANIYKNIIPVAKGADSWTISAYQRAIILDPTNPSLRFGLGGIYYQLEKYNDAANFFVQAVDLKPNWPNAYYNLAWAYFKNKEYDKAVNAMKNTADLIDKKTNPEDWKKANDSLVEFKKASPEAK